MYLCYGLHMMLNVVADMEGVGAAVLIRSCSPVTGMLNLFFYAVCLDHKICYNYSLTRWLVEWEMLGAYDVVEVPIWFLLSCT